MGNAEQFKQPATTIYHVAHTIAGRLYTVSAVEAENEDDALDEVKESDDKFIGERFVMDHRDPMDEYEIVDEHFLTEPPQGIGPLASFDIHALAAEIRRRGAAVCVFVPEDADGVIRDDADSVQFIARHSKHLEDRMIEIGNEALEVYAKIDGIAADDDDDPGTCILTAENMHTADDCTMHDHEDDGREYVVTAQSPNVGARCCCDRCGQDLEWTGNVWHDRGGGSKCGPYKDAGEIVHENYTKPHVPNWTP